jgi:hypothetical protein
MLDTKRNLLHKKKVPPIYSPFFTTHSSPPPTFHSSLILPFRRLCNSSQYQLVEGEPESEREIERKLSVWRINSIITSTKLSFNFDCEINSKLHFWEIFFFALITPLSATFSRANETKIFTLAAFKIYNWN